MTDGELEAIESRAEAATPGPWKMHDPAGLGQGWDIDPDITVDGDGLGSIERADDAHFIAHAREDVPALTTEVRRLRWFLLQRQDGAESLTEIYDSLNPAYVDWCLGGQAGAERPDVYRPRAELRPE